MDEEKSKKVQEALVKMDKAAGELPGEAILDFLSFLHKSKRGDFKTEEESRVEAMKIFRRWGVDNVFEEFVESCFGTESLAKYKQKH